MTAPLESFFQSLPPPEDLHEVTTAVRSFLELHRAARRPVALVTSGGTVAPIEKHTVRFIDNFSSGSRGAASTEYFIARGYAVILLYRESSLKPYQRHFAKENVLEWFTADGGRVKASLSPEKEAKLADVLAKYSKSKDERTLLSLPYTTLFQYLHLLKRVSSLLSELGPQALIYLAAAVSDFYIPPDAMAEHKIQSSGELDLHFSQTPKLVGLLREQWAPQALIVTFKTDEKVLIESAKAALRKYKHQVVVANLLSTRRTSVTIVTGDFQEALHVTEEETGRGVEIEEKLVNVLIDRYHRSHI